MSNEFANPTGINWNNADHTSGTVQFGDDSKLFVQFYVKSVLNQAKSREQNKPWYDNVNYIIIQQPGERLNQINRPVTDNDKLRFGGQWRQFLANQVQVPEGTPIELLFPNNPAYADSLKALGIFTIQQAANLSSYGIDAIGMGGQETVNKAKRYLDESDNSAAYNRLTTEISKKDQEIKILREAQEKQKALIDDLYSRLGGNMALPVSDNRTLQHVPGYDPQQERINNLHVTKELGPKNTGTINKAAMFNPVPIEGYNEIKKPSKKAAKKPSMFNEVAKDEAKIVNEGTFDLPSEDFDL